MPKHRTAIHGRSFPFELMPIVLVQTPVEYHTGRVMRRVGSLGTETGTSVPVTFQRFIDNSLSNREGQAQMSDWRLDHEVIDLDDRNRQDIDTEPHQGTYPACSKLEEPRRGLLNIRFIKASTAKRGFILLWPIMYLRSGISRNIYKALQQKLSCVAVPWVPEGDPSLQRLINEIVLGEETGEDGQGRIFLSFQALLERDERMWCRHRSDRSDGAQHIKSWSCASKLRV